jgi:GT2 family glycosyltransferase
MRTIAAVIVTYNRKDLLQTSIDCLLAQRFDNADANLSILIIDNASTDGTPEALKPRIDAGEVRYFNTGANLGGAGGFNFGMKRAVLDGYDYLWVMDDDCQPAPDALQAFLDADAQLAGQWGYLSSVVRWTDGSICKMNVQRHPLTHDIEDFTPDVQPCTLASFVSLFVAAKTVVEVGLPIKEFFIWTDDWDFTRRISRTRPCYVVGKSIVVHASKNNGAGTIATDTPDRLDRYRKIYRNDVVLYREEGFKGFCYVFTRALYHIVQVIAHSKGNRCKKIGIIISSNFAGIKFHPAIEYIDPADIRPVS